MDTKKTSGISQEDQARLNAMGHDRVMADLARKYKQPIVEDNAPPKKASEFSVMDHLKQRRDNFLRELDGLPKHRETYRKSELESIIEVEKRLRDFIANFDQATVNLPEKSTEYQAICERYIEQVLRYLDQQSFWTYKLTTEDSGGASFDQPLEYTDHDSVYYVTQSGISLRLKRSVSGLGLGTVIQPFYEKIVFKMPNTDLKETEPHIGAQVTEYRSNEFAEVVKSGKVSKDIESSNEIYTKDGKVFFVASNDPRPHIGDRVNKIF